MHNAMSLATLGADGFPQVRIVLLKAMSGDGFDFFTNLDSAKANDLQAEPRASILFFWPELERQIRVSGVTHSLSREDVERYHRSRPRNSQISAWASAQSHVVPSRDYLEQAWQRIEASFVGQEIPAPPNWGGYHVSAQRFEFWQGRESRLHDRIVYERDLQQQWQRIRLAP
jgi:pyridoxamine 5'-phosphate oxidase